MAHVDHDDLIGGDQSAHKFGTELLLDRCVKKTQAREPECYQSMIGSGNDATGVLPEYHQTEVSTNDSKAGSIGSASPGTYPSWGMGVHGDAHFSPKFVDPAPFDTYCPRTRAGEKGNGEGKFNIAYIPREVVIKNSVDDVTAQARLRDRPARCKESPTLPWGHGHTADKSIPMAIGKLKDALQSYGDDENEDADEDDDAYDGSGLPEVNENEDKVGRTGAQQQRGEDSDENDNDEQSRLGGVRRKNKNSAKKSRSHKYRSSLYIVVPEDHNESLHVMKLYILGEDGINIKRITESVRGSFLYLKLIGNRLIELQVSAPYLAGFAAARKFAIQLLRRVYPEFLSSASPLTRIIQNRIQKVGASSSCVIGTATPTPTPQQNRVVVDSKHCGGIASSHQNQVQRSERPMYQKYPELSQPRGSTSDLYVATKQNRVHLSTNQWARSL